MSIINKSNWGNCSVCSNTDCACVKVGKELVCIDCRNMQKVKTQIQKAKEKNKVRGLGTLQKESGDFDAASRQNLINDCDYVFSRIVRLRAADEYLNCTCYTCGAVKHWSLMQCGHYSRRGNMALRYDFQNSRVQDKHCNEFLGGNYEVYRANLEKEETGLADQLELKSREVYKYSIDELKGLLISLRFQLKPLELRIKK